MKRRQGTENLNESVIDIMFDTLGEGFTRTLPVTDDPIIMLIRAGISAIGFAITSPVWLPSLYVYAVGKSIHNKYKLKHLPPDNALDNDVNDKETIRKYVADINQIPKFRPPALKFSLDDVDRQTLSALEVIPKDVSGLIGQHVDHKSLSNLMKCSKTSHALFNESWKVALLLKYVKDANYSKARKMASENPMLMFKSATVQLADGSYEFISPLRLSFKLLDTYMWKIFKEVTQDEKYSEIFQKHYLAQIHAQASSLIDLEPLFNAHQAFFDLYTSWQNGAKVTAEEMSEALLHISVMQQQLLPMHIWREYCRTGSSWSREARFDTNEEPHPKNLKKYAFMFEPDTRLGSKEVCMRGNHRQSVSVAAVTVEALKLYPTSDELDQKRLEDRAEALNNDGIILNRLLEKRMDDFAKELSSLTFDTELSKMAYHN